MYNFSRYQAKELALAYMSSKNHDLSPEEFLLQLKRIEKSFNNLLKEGQEQLKDVLAKTF
ncbi:hypothetical protein [Edaphovirga cremea]|uniref:hypothetical protein n=1 Tax=Edaphovirga cremea TaxID=2267246 RepID=UPI000DEF391A|nr:hypothetical protein [Edaphovirga cremea]